MILIGNYTLEVLMKNVLFALVFGEIFIIPLVLRTRGIINISPNTRAIFHSYYSNRVISYTKIIHFFNIMVKYERFHPA